MNNPNNTVDYDIAEYLTDMFEELGIEYNGTVVERLGIQIESMIESGELSKETV